MMRVTSSFDDAARGNRWARLGTFAFVTFALVRFTGGGNALWHIVGVMALAVVAFEIAIAVLKMRQRDHAASGDALVAMQRRDTLAATGVLCAVLVASTVAFGEPWFGVLTVVCAYVGFLFSRYVPEALFGAREEQV